MKVQFLVLTSLAVLTPAYGEVPFADFSIGPYPSALSIYQRSVPAVASANNANNNYSDCERQGYLLQSIGTLLMATKDLDFIPGDINRATLMDIAFEEIFELMASPSAVSDGGPAFGRNRDDSYNPPLTSYAWQSGLVALGIAQFLQYLHETDQYTRAEEIEIFLRRLLRYWDDKYEPSIFMGEELGYYWNSAVDNMPVHNTSALLAMASQIYSEITGDAVLSQRPLAFARFFQTNLELTSQGGYKWKRAVNPAPLNIQIPEDISHALNTLQFLRFCSERGWYSRIDNERVARTILNQMWSENPARMNPRVDGSSAIGDNEDKKRAFSSAAMIGLAVHADATGGKPEIFDYARSVFVSSYLTHFGKPIDAASVDAIRCLGLAQLLAHRPFAYQPDSRWSIVAGDSGDQAAPTDAGGGVRFDTHWSSPGPVTSDQEPYLVGRTTTAPTDSSSIVIDLQEYESRRVVVSVTYLANADGAVQQWDGTAYRHVSSLPTTKTDTNKLVWMRTSFVIDPTRYFDYQPGVAGKNISLRFTKVVSLHRIEATPIN